MSAYNHPRHSGIEEMARVTFQDIKIGEVTEVACGRMTAMFTFPSARDRLFPGKRHELFFFTVDITVVVYPPRQRNAAKLLQHRNARPEETHIPRTGDGILYMLLPPWGIATSANQDTKIHHVNVAHRIYIGS